MKKIFLWAILNAFLILLHPITPARAATNKDYLRAGYNSQENRFFLVWTDGRNSSEGVECYKTANCNPDVYAAFLDQQLNLGQEFPLVTQQSEQGYPEVIYNSQRNEYLVVYQQLDEDFNIYALRINKDGQILNTIPVCQEEADQWEPTIAYDNLNDRYLIAWMSNTGDFGKDIQTQLLSADGQKIGQVRTVSLENNGSPAPGKQERPVAIFISEEQKYFLVWEDEGRNGGSGTVLDKDGQIVISPKNFFYTQNSDRVVYPQISYSSYNRQIMVTWQEGLTGTKKIKAQRLSTSGLKIGETITFDDNTAPIDQPFQNPRPGIACDAENGSCLVGWFNWLDYAGKLQFIDKDNQIIGSTITGLSSRPTIVLNSRERYFLVIKSDNPAQFKKMPSLASLPKLTPTPSPSLVPSASPTPLSTNSPSPTPSTEPTNIFLNFKANLEDINQTCLIKLTAKDTNFTKNIISKTDSIYRNVTITNVSPNQNYDFVLFSFPFLSVKKTFKLKLGINPDDNSVLDFGKLKIGDLNGDNQINGLDWSLMKQNFGESGEE